MPVLSLPLPLLSNIVIAQSQVWFPIRIPFPIMRIGSILPHSINGPFKDSLLALFRLAWSTKLHLPVLITVCFMAFDIRLQLEINIFWEHPRPNNTRQHRDRRGDSVRATVANAAALIQRQRHRLQLQERRARLLETELNGRHTFPSTRVEDITDSDIDGLETGEELELELGSVHTDTGVLGEMKKTLEFRKRKRTKKSTKMKLTSARNTTEDSSSEDESDTEEEEEVRKSEDDSDSDESGASDSDDDLPDPDLRADGDLDFYGDDNDGSDGGSSDNDSDDDDSGTPLVVELEIRQRPGFKEVGKRLSCLVTSLAQVFRRNQTQIVPLSESESELDKELVVVLDPHRTEEEVF